MLIRDEGRVPHAYQDSLGFWTIGVGHLIDQRRGGRIPDYLIDELLEWDIANKSGEVFHNLPWVQELSEERQAVIIAMAFQLGINGVKNFKKALAHLKEHRYAEAALEFLDSTVAREQAPERWKRFANQIERGEWII